MAVTVGGGTARPSRRVLRRVGAVFAGLLLNAVLATATDELLRATGVFPPMQQPMADALFALATAYRTVFGIAGCYVAARLAPDRPMLHALWLGGVGLVLCLVGVVVALGQGPAFGPLWYPLLLCATVLPSAWVGGRLATHRRQRAGGHEERRGDLLRPSATR
ncbi:hypothetical protein [Pyxidicoccus sp. MSG2]|uniref:hypothetical protein n=1 Tax=Pyxidicoccus sp. MSG2 TaxID=2996790 RepID=UPI002271C410|nr:hypothetical protein [Pyxidicoccus sp. MSG2]MCY1018152.1 hypothetical protein [Pyxidicoccus sp. MSG2]